MRLLQFTAGWHGVPSVGQPVMVSIPGSSGPNVPEGAQEETHSSGTGSVPTCSGKLKRGCYPMTWEYISEKKQVEMSAM